MKDLTITNEGIMIASAQANIVLEIIVVVLTSIAEMTKSLTQKRLF